ncbi:hypothetical protein FQN53_003918 [Emmonsiellopsis sp. PD_33]|nr:hypothetical protein FQN53_003918 [Emmonsiellopsis sp. PD_33]
MASPSGVVVISVTTAVTVFVTVLVVTILCLRFCRKHRALLLPQDQPHSLPQYYSDHGPQSMYPRSRGLFQSTLGFPYGGARQWSAIGSTETVHQQLSPGIPIAPPPCHTADSRCSRLSTHSTRNSRRLQKRPSRDIALQTLQPESACIEPQVVDNQDVFPENAVELRADNSPKSKPAVRQDESISAGTGIRVASWPMGPTKRSYHDPDSITGDDLMPDTGLSKRRSESIMNQAPGSPPKQPVPPLPTNRPLGIPRLTRHDSMVISNMSLDTVGSSILDYPLKENGHGMVDLEAARPEPLRTHERYTSAYGWGTPASANTRPSRIPQIASPRRYNSTSAGSCRPAGELASPRRSASMHDPIKSSQAWAVQSPHSSRPSYGPPPGTSRSLTSDLRRQCNTYSQRQPPPVYELNSYSRTDHNNSHGHRQGVPNALQPISENEQNTMVRQQNRNSNGSPSKRIHASSSSLSSIPTRTSTTGQKKGHKRQNSVRISIERTVPTALSPTIEVPEESSRPSTPQQNTTTTNPVSKMETASEGPSGNVKPNNPFDKENKHTTGEQGQITPTPLQRGLGITGGETGTFQRMTRPKPSPNSHQEIPNIPRRSSLRRNSIKENTPPTRSSSTPPNICSSGIDNNQSSMTNDKQLSFYHSMSPTNTGPYRATTSSPVTPTPSSIHRSPSLQNYTNIIAKMDKEKDTDNSYNDVDPVKSPTGNSSSPSSSLITTETSTLSSPPAIPRPLPMTPQPLSIPRPPKFRAALSTIRSVSNIAVEDEDELATERYGDEGNKNTNEPDSPDSTSTITPSRYEIVSNGKYEGSSVSTPLRTGMVMATGQEQTPTSLVRTPGSIYDQFGFLKE